MSLIAYGTDETSAFARPQLNIATDLRHVDDVKYNKKKKSNSLYGQEKNNFINIFYSRAEKLFVFL